MISRSSRRLKPVNKGWAGDNRASAAVEFAIVAGVLVSLLLGVADLVPALLAKFKAGNATNSAADLMTHSQQLQSSDVSDIFSVAADVLAPFASTSLTLRLTSVASDGLGNATVHWSCGQGALPAYTAKTAVTQTPPATASTSVSIATQ